jgi:HEAT repeat protein
MPVDEPSPRLRTRFYESLSAYREGLSHARRWQPWQMAAGIALLIAGFGTGYLAHREPSSEMKELRSEVASMRQMVALSLLQQQGSASERLRGVSLAYEVEPSNSEVLSALVTAVNHDSNVNVRLAAVDALRNFAGSPVTRRAAVESLPQQDMPLVQVALIDLLVDIKDRQAAPDLRKLADDASVNDDVKERALWALTRLQQ